LCWFSYFCIGHYDEGKCRHVQCATTNFPSHTVQRLGWEDPGHAVLAPTAKKPKAAARTTAKKVRLDVFRVGLESHHRESRLKGSSKQPGS
jgi:hypothetical protein